MRNVTFWVVLSALAVASVYMMPAAAQVAPKDSDKPWEALLGKPAPPVKLELLGGGTFDLGSFKDKKVVVMEFWASWCPPCRILMPVFAEVATAYKDKDVMFVGINQAEPADKVKAFMESNKLAFPVALDTKGDVSTVYMVDSIPRLVVVGKDGTVQSIHAGLEGRTVKQAQSNAKQKLTQEIDKLLAGQKLVLPQPSEPTQEAKTSDSEKS